MEKGVQRWVVDISKWDPTPHDFSFALSLLPQHHHSSITRYVKIEDRKRALVSRLLQYALVHQVLGIPFEEININRTSEGKPYLECDQASMDFPNFNFNVSHHGDYVAIAAEPLCLVGLDIVSCMVPCRETIPEFVRNFSSYFSSYEWDKIINAGNSEEILIEFYSCPYLSTAVSCQKNGRPDSDYQKWKWKPHSCSIPRFDALKFLAKMRKKRIMLVGDSIMRNQWESLVCLVQGVVPTGRKKVTYSGLSMAFHALDFETSIEFSWAPLLVELKKGPENKRILHLDLIEDNARYWRGADILVFDSAHWWTHSENGSSWDYYMEGQFLFKSMNPMIAYQKGLTTWAKWIDLNVDPHRTGVIFRSMSPRHNRENGWNCNKQKPPQAFSSHQHVPEQLLILKEVLRRMRFPVYLQDMTTMSALRGDGHPSVYRRSMDQEERQHSKDSADCSHWCLPGVPDIWNEMLSALL